MILWTPIRSLLSLQSSMEKRPSLSLKLKWVWILENKYYQCCLNLNYSNLVSSMCLLAELLKHVRKNVEIISHFIFLQAPKWLEYPNLYYKMTQYALWLSWWSLAIQLRWGFKSAINHVEWHPLSHFQYSLMFIDGWERGVDKCHRMEDMATASETGTTLELSFSCGYIPREYSLLICYLFIF